MAQYGDGIYFDSNSEIEIKEVYHNNSKDEEESPTYGNENQINNDFHLSIRAH